MTYDYNEWLKNPIKLFCKCGCGKEIIIKPHHKYYGISEYIHGHNCRIYPISDSYQKWLDNGCPKVICNCGCGEEIVIKSRYKYDDIPKSINGHFTEERKQKLRDANLGKKLPEETKQKIKESNLGKHHTEESKQKIKENHQIGKVEYHLNHIVQDSIIN